MPPAVTEAPIAEDRDAEAPRLQRAQAEEHGAWAPTGRWTALAFSQPGHWARLERSLKDADASQSGASQAWDLRGLAQLDHIGAQLLWNHWGGQWPAQIEAGEHQAVLDHVSKYTTAVPQLRAPTLADVLHRIGAKGPDLLRVGRDSLTLLGQLIIDLAKLARAPHRGPWRDISGHLYQTGATALPITALVGLLIGVVLAYLMSNQLRNFGAESFIVNILGLSLIRELGPVLAAVLIAGRSGSAMTAQ
ncbi:MAG: ABC transporter permease, partial [Comamonadaceae bacterium]